MEKLVNKVEAVATVLHEKIDYSHGDSDGLCPICLDHALVILDALAQADRKQSPVGSRHSPVGPSADGQSPVATRQSAVKVETGDCRPETTDTAGSEPGSIRITDLEICM
jgi:hypothetical protein